MGSPFCVGGLGGDAFDYAGGGDDFVGGEAVGEREGLIDVEGVPELEGEQSPERPEMVVAAHVSINEAGDFGGVEDAGGFDAAGGQIFIYQRAEVGAEPLGTGLKEAPFRADKDFRREEIGDGGF